MQGFTLSPVDSLTEHPAKIEQVRHGWVVSTLQRQLDPGHSKANPCLLRGFTLDHGTDLATSVNGLAVNMASQGQGHSDTDLNLLILKPAQHIGSRPPPCQSRAWTARRAPPRWPRCAPGCQPAQPGRRSGR